MDDDAKQEYPARPEGALPLVIEALEMVAADSCLWGDNCVEHEPGHRGHPRCAPCTCRAALKAMGLERNPGERRGKSG